MELSAHRISPDPFGVHVLHACHPQCMELGSRANYSSRPIFSISSSPSSRYAHKRGVLDHTDESIGSPCHSSRPISEARLGVEPSHNPYDPSGVDERPTAAPAKRARALDDVDGPGTAKLSVKKRRLLLRLVTSRLSRPFSLPATNILIRESSDNMPVLHRIQHCVGARRVGHQSALIRKAAILNRVRIGVRTAAISRGHMVMADFAARGSALNHDLLLVTTPPPAMFPTRATVAKGNGNGNEGVPPAWRPHTTSFHPPVAHKQHYPQQHYYSQSVDTANRFDSRSAGAHPGGGSTVDSTRCIYGQIRIEKSRCRNRHVCFRGRDAAPQSRHLPTSATRRIIPRFRRRVSRTGTPISRTMIWMMYMRTSASSLAPRPSPRSLGPSGARSRSSSMRNILMSWMVFLGLCELATGMRVCVCVCVCLLREWRILRDLGTEAKARWNEFTTNINASTAHSRADWRMGVSDVSGID